MVDVGMGDDDSPLRRPADIYAPFDTSGVRRLRSYVADVEAFVTSGFFNGPGLTLTIGGETGVGSLTERLEAPSDEAVRAVVPLFRQLYSDTEPTSYTSTIRLLSENVQRRDSPRRAEAIDALRALRRWKREAIKQQGLVIRSNGEELTIPILIELFLHGRFLHKDDDKVATLDMFQLEAMLMFEFLGAIKQLAQIFWVGRNVVRPILDTPSLLSGARAA